jgi:hypothetical protein
MPSPNHDPHTHPTFGQPSPDRPNRFALARLCPTCSSRSHLTLIVSGPTHPSWLRPTLPCSTRPGHAVSTSTSRPASPLTRAPCTFSIKRKKNNRSRAGSRGRRTIVLALVGRIMDHPLIGRGPRDKRGHSN